MASYITTHNSEGKAIFSPKVGEPRVVKFPGGQNQMFYTCHTNKPDLSSESDIDQYTQDNANGLPDGSFCPPNGFAAGLVAFEPNSESVMHRTMTLDFLTVVEGVVEVHLDSGEKRTLKVGDSITQRGTKHKWVNVTPNDGWVRMVAIAHPIVQPLKVAGQELTTDYEYVHK